MHSTVETICILGTIALVTAFTRAFPYLVFGGRRSMPAMARYLGQALPPAIMVILVAYCLRNASFTAYPFALPEVAASLLVVGLHLWKRNSMLSILAGTLSYIFLLQLV